MTMHNDATTVAAQQYDVTSAKIASLVDEANAAQEWMREPDWVDDFSLSDMADWLNKRPTSLLPRLISALSSERAAHAETKRALDGAIKAAVDQATLRGEAEGKLAASEMAGIVDGWKRRAEAAEAKLAEAMKVIEPFALVAECDIGEDEGDEDIFWPISNARYSMAGRLRVGDLRAVRAYRDKGRE